MKPEEFIEKHPVAIGCLAIIACLALMALVLGFIGAVFGSIFGSIAFFVYAVFKALMGVFGI